MRELMHIGVLPVAVTLAAYWIGTLCQKKWKSPLFNPILIAMGLVIVFLLASKMDTKAYTQGASYLSWLMTPATISLAIPMYEQLQVLKKNGRAIAAGVTAGAVSCLAVLLAGIFLLKLDRIIAVSILPKSVTAAIGVPLSQLYGGIGAVTTASIAVTGICANMLGVSFCRLFGITDPIARGVAFGTAGHVIGTTKASELSQLTGAVSSLSLVVAGLLTAVIFPALAGIL